MHVAIYSYTHRNSHMRMDPHTGIHVWDTHTHIYSYGMAHAYVYIAIWYGTFANSFNLLPQVG